MSATTNGNNNTAPPSGAPREAHQRAIFLKGTLLALALSIVTQAATPGDIPERRFDVTSRMAAIFVR